MTGARRADREAGSALVEFLGVSLLLLIPLVYLVLVLAKVQAAAFAVEGAAKEATRAFVLAEDAAAGAQRAETAVHLALGDQGFAPADGRLAMRCAEAGCLVPGAAVTAEVAVDVALPGVPSSLLDGVPLRIPVSAAHTALVDPLREEP